MRLHHLLAASLCGLLFLAPVHAGPIDDALLRRAPQLFRELKSKGYKNVGVLKFRVEKGGKAATFHAGPLNNNMTLRVEEALVRANDDENPIGITHNASETAAETDARLSYLTPEGRKKLLTLAYPMAWGTDKVQVDAFITGVVQISPDYQTTVVKLQIFDRANPELRDLLQFEVQTNRSVLADAGESFALTEPKIVTRGELSGLSKAFESEKPAAEKPVAPPVQQKKPPQGGGATAPETPGSPGEFKKATMTAVAKVQLEIFYDDQPVHPVFDPSSPGEMMIPAPGTGQKVHFILRNTTGDQLGVVLRVNGVNTLYKEHDDREVKQYAKWILQPNKAYTVAGFYPDPHTLERFQIRPADAARREELGHVADQGLIQMDYFMAATAQEAEMPSEKRSISLRKLSHPDLAKDKPATLAELRSRMRKLAAPVQTRNLIMPGEKQASDLKEVSFDHSVHAGSLTIRYYQPKGSTP